MRSKNRISLFLCAALTAVSFLYPFFGNVSHAEEIAGQVQDGQDPWEETEPEEDGEEETPEEERSQKAEPEKTDGADGEKKETLTEEETKGPEIEETETGEPGEKDIAESGETEGSEEAEEPEKIKEAGKGAEIAEEAEEQRTPEETGGPEAVRASGAPEGECAVVAFYYQYPGEDYFLLDLVPADGEGRVDFPSVPVPDDCQAAVWADADGNRADADTVFDRDTKLYVSFIPGRRQNARSGVMAASIDSASQAGASQTWNGYQTQSTYRNSNIQHFTVPVSGVYEIVCQGGHGGDGWAVAGYREKRDGKGSAGASRGSRVFLKEGMRLTLYVGGSANFDRGTKYGAWSDGGTGEHLDNDEDDNWKMILHTRSGGGGGSSYVMYNGVKIISARGGGGGDAYAESDAGSQHAPATAGGGETCLNNTGDITWLRDELDASSANSGADNGYIRVTLLRPFPKAVLRADEGWTNKDVKISASVADKDGLPETYLSWEQDEAGNDIWTDVTTYTVSCNGIYTCKVRDSSGNTMQTAYEVKNIDRLAPKAQLTASGTEWTDGDIVLSAEGKDADQTQEDGRSDLHDQAWMWGFVDVHGNPQWEKRNSAPEGGGEEAAEEESEKLWTKESSYTVSRNGTYLCRLRDKAGNITEVTCKVGNIDRTPPQVTCDRPEKWYEGSMKVTLTAQDLQPDGTQGCGLDDLAYSSDGVHFSSDPELVIDAEGIYTVWVRDKLGNVKKTEFAFYYDTKKKDGDDDKGSHGGKGGSSPGGGAVIPDAAQLIPAPLEVPEILWEETDHSSHEDNTDPAENGIKRDRRPASGAETPIPETAFEEKEMEETEESEEVQERLPVLNEQGKEQPAPEMMEQEDNGHEKIGWKKLILYSVWMAAALCGLVWLLFCLILEHVTVYRREDDGKYEKAGRCAIIRKKDYKQINLTRLMQKGEDRDYKVRFSRAFVLLHKNDKVLLRTYQGVELRNVAREIEISACNS